jgi:molecular chaperone GrpE
MTDDATPAVNETETEMALTPEDLEALHAELAQLKEQVLRYAAEAENTKRRAEREANDARAYAIQKFAKDLLGVADNLARARAHAPADAKDPQVKSLAVGLEMTEKDLLSAFERNGLTRVDPARGAKFDPHQHQAVMEREAADLGAGAVLEVLQPGYELYGRIVRPAMVVVSAKGSKGETPADPVSANPYAHPEVEPDEAGGAVDRKA